MIREARCKICRRAGVKLFLKGEKCMSPKCPILKRPYPPGFQGKRRRVFLSDYGKQLREKQKLKNWYNLGERQFKKYIKDALNRRGQAGDAQSILIENLERRLDNVVFRLGFCTSRPQARQLVNHAHFLVNGKKVNIPSYQVKKGDKISLRPSSKRVIFQDLDPKLKRHQPPVWLKLDSSKLEGSVVGGPSLEETAPPAEMSTIFEFYSR